MWSVIYQFHQSIFRDILKCNIGLFEFKADKALKSFWVVPLIANNNSDIDLDISTLQQYISLTQPTKPEDFLNRVISVNYHNKDSDVLFYHVTAIHPTITPISRFPDSSKYTTYQNYLLQKYNVKFAHEHELHQPGLIAEYSSSFINLTVNRYIL